MAQAQAREEGCTDLTEAVASRLLSAVQCPLLLVDGQGALRWANALAAELIGPGAESLHDAMEEVDADALAASCARGEALRLPVRLECHPEHPAFLAVLEPVGDGRALITFTQPESDATISGQPGRATFMRRLERSVQRARLDERYVFATLLVNLRGIALANSSLGRGSGAALLRAVAGRLRDAVRPGDEVAQLAGDEFGVLLDRVGSAVAALAATERIQQALLPPCPLEGQELSAGASIGVSLSTTGYIHPEEAVRDAAVALDRAKRHGPGCVEVYDPAMRTRALERIRLEGELRRGVERSEFLLYFQPIVDMVARTPYGFEALLRWQHPTRGLLSPAEYLRLAEETGLIVPIVDGVFAAACTQVRAWRERFGPVSLSMNFTAVHFHRASVVDTVFQGLAASGLEPEGLVVEVTETALLTDFAPVAAALDELRGRGVRVHLDDFGTGYSSLSYLHNLPIDALKIDRSFVSRLNHAPSAVVLVKTILDLATSLGKRAIAEGVETSAEAEQLLMLGCRLGQGYFYGRPMPVAEAEEWLCREPREVP